MLIIAMLVWVAFALIILITIIDSDKKDVAFWSCVIIANVYLAQSL